MANQETAKQKGAKKRQTNEPHKLHFTDRSERIPQIHLCLPQTVGQLQAKLTALFVYKKY